MLKHGSRKHREQYASRMRRARRGDYDRTWEYEAADEQARWDEAQDEALPPLCCGTLQRTHGGRTVIFHHMTLLHVIVICYAAFACLCVLRLWPRR